MPAPLVAAAAAKPAGEAVTGIVKVLSTDIVKLEGKVYRRIVRKVPLEKDGKLLFTEKGRVRYAKVESLEPIDVSLHANPIGLGVLAVGAAAGAILGLIAWNGIEIHSGLGNITLVKGLKETRQETASEPPPMPMEGESIACSLARTLPFPLNVPWVAVCAAGG